MGKKRRSEPKRHGKIFYFMMYSAFTVMLTGLVVTGYYLVSNGIIFGKFQVKENTYKVGEGAVTEVDPQKIIVTPQNQADAVPLTSENENLPKIPPVNGVKATKDNPFVVLEIVPELSQQSLSYLVESEEKGLPFNPVELGIKRCNEKSNERGFLDSNKQIDENNARNNIVPRDYGYFEGNFQGEIRISGDISNGETMPYYNIDFLYDLELYSSDISKEEFEQKSVHELIKQYPEAFAFASPDQISTEINEDGKVVPVYQDRSLQFAFNEKDRDGNYTDRNWVKSVQENQDVTKSFKLTTSVDSGLTDDDFNTLTMQQLAQKYPDIFAKDDNDRVIPENILAKNEKWTREKKEIEERKTKGYFINVGKGRGQYTLSGEFWDNAGLSARKTGTDTDMWNYVENTQYPNEAFDFSVRYAGNDWLKGRHLCQNESDLNAYYSESCVGEYIRMEYTEGDTGYNAYQHTVALKTAVYAFDYAKYVYTLKYAGLEINDILRYALLIRDTPEEYEDLYVQVIVVTPEMINEMDANDTENTIDYIERADVIYLSEYNDGYDETAVDVGKFVKLFHEYADAGSGNGSEQSDVSKLKTFSDNDLEWWDCLKLIKRLSTTRNLPMMLTKLVGSEAVKGVDGTQNVVQYIHQGKTEADGSTSIAAKTSELMYGAMNNISKLYYILAQFNLLDRKSEAEANTAPGEDGWRRTFMDDIFPQLKVMKLNEDQQCSSDYPAKYTGYYERTPLADSSSYDQEYKERCYYCWNKFTFVPTDLAEELYHENYEVLAKKYGFLPKYFYANTLQNSDDDKRGVGSTNGSNGQDGQNVTIAREYVDVDSDGNNDNLNESIPKGITALSGMLEILRNIGDQYDRVPNALSPNLQSNKKAYVRMKNDQVLLDFDSAAAYRDENKLIGLKFIFADSNNEDAVIRKLSLVKTEEGSDEKILELLDDNNHKVSKENVAFSNGEDLIDGYRVLAGDNLTVRYVPFKLSDWKSGYVILKIEWTTRLRVDRNNNSIFNSREGTSYVYIGERALSNLE